MRFERLSARVRSLRFRLAAWNTLVLLAVVVAALLVVHVALRVTLLREIDQRLVEDAAEFGLTIAGLYPNEKQIIENMSIKATSHRDEGLFLQLIDDENKAVWQSGETPDLPWSEPAGDGPTVFEVAGYRVAQRRLTEDGMPHFTVRAGCSLDLVSELVARRTMTMAWVGGFIVLLAPLGGFWLAGQATRPLARIIQTASRLRPNHLEDRLPLHHTGDELDQLSRTINRFLDLVASYLGRKREFVANAAHELRSPLAAIQSSIEVALNADRSTEEYKDLLYSLAEQCGSLTALVNQLLMLADNESDTLAAARAPVSLAHIATTSLDMFRPAAEERGLELHAESNAAPAVLGNASRLRQVVNNLIDNSLKFTPPGGKVFVELRHDARANQVVLVVRDTGVGISPEDMPNIFERFYRGDKSRLREGATRGNGLGLSICLAIVEAHGGTLSAESQPGRGTTFVARLPAQPGAPGAAANPIGLST